MNSLRVRLAELPDNYFHFFVRPKCYMRMRNWLNLFNGLQKKANESTKRHRCSRKWKEFSAAAREFAVPKSTLYGHSYIRFVQTYWYSALHSPQSTIILFNASKTLVDAQSVPAVRFHSLREASLKCSELPASLIIRHFKKLRKY